MNQKDYNKIGEIMKRDWVDVNRLRTELKEDRLYQGIILVEEGLKSKLRKLADYFEKENPTFCGESGCKNGEPLGQAEGWGLCNVCGTATKPEFDKQDFLKKCGVEK